MKEIDISFAKQADLTACMEIDNVADEEIIGFRISRSDICLAVEDGVVVGYLRLGYLWEHIPMIDIAIVKEAHRRKGIATALVDFICNHLGREGGDRLISSTMPDNLPSQKWHRKMGFEECGFLCGINSGEKTGEIFYVKKLATNNQ